MSTEDSYSDEEYEYYERRSWLPWITLLVIVGIIIYLYLTYGVHRGANLDDKPTVSSAQTVLVPDVVGMEGDSAEALLDQLGLVAEEEISYDVLGTPGSVGYQDPEGGTRVKPGTTVAIGIIGVGNASRGGELEAPEYKSTTLKSRPAKQLRTESVPSLVGLTEKAATERLESLGFAVRPMYQPRTERLGRVIEQAPEPGERIPYGEQVHLLIAVSSEPARAPAE